MVEQRTENPCVPGSIPGGTTVRRDIQSLAFFYLIFAVMKITKPKFFRSAAALSAGLRLQLKGRRYVLLSDETVSGCCLPLLADFLAENPPLDIVEVEPGEESKSIEVCTELWHHFMELNVDRGDVLVCLGGGSICDLGGFVAATFKRGLPCVFIPTTLLAMTDAAIGGKNGIDFNGVKNMIGTFALPEQILIYPEFCDSLTNDERLSGMAEIFKHALIGNAELWSMLLTLNAQKLDFSSRILRLSIDVKLSIVRNDLLERGDRVKLNFGHTIGHAIESVQLQSGNPIPHGIAVAMGMFVEITLSVNRGILGADQAKQWQLILMGLFGDKWPKWPDWSVISDYIKQDKKRESVHWRMALLQSLGFTGVVNNVTLLDMENAYIEAIDSSSKIF